MSKLRTFAKYWLPVVLWAVVIYSASGDQQSVQHSSRIIEPIVRWLFPDLSNEAVATTVFVIRKGAHVTEYAVLALFLGRALRGTLWRESANWSWACAASAWLASVVFAASDEWHQTFVPGRQGSPWDVLIDSIGAAAGLLLWWGLRRWRRAR